jgi:hypothetical protein
VYRIFVPEPGFYLSTINTYRYEYQKFYS